MNFPRPANCPLPIFNEVAHVSLLLDPWVGSGVGGGGEGRVGVRGERRVGVRGSAGWGCAQGGGAGVGVRTGLG